MRWIRASSIVALVQDIHADRNVSKMDSPRNSVGPLLVPLFNHKYCVTSPVVKAYPYPTWAKFGGVAWNIPVFIYSGKESFLDSFKVWWDGGFSVGNHNDYMVLSLAVFSATTLLTALNFEGKQ